MFCFWLYIFLHQREHAMFLFYTANEKVICENAYHKYFCLYLHTAVVCDLCLYSRYCIYTLSQKSTLQCL